MYNIKIYDRNGNFKTTLSEKSIDCSYNFSWNVNNGFAGLSFQYHWNLDIQHKDRVKIFRGGESIYQGFVSKISTLEDKMGKRLEISLTGMIGLLAFKPYPNQQHNTNPWNIIKSIFSWMDAGFDVSNVHDYTWNILINSESHTYLTFLQEVLKNTSDYALFLDEENSVYFWPYQDNHLLTYGDSVFWIDITEDSTNYFNKVTLKYDGWNVIVQDNEWISKFGENHIVVEENDIKNLTTAQIRAISLLNEYTITKNIKVQINRQYDFDLIKPWHTLTIRNSEWVLENKPVKQVSYWKDTATVILDSYQSLERFILKSQKNV